MVEVGLAMFPTEYAIDPARLGKAVEDAGFESLFFPEHTHIPASRDTPYPGGGELPREYAHAYDPFVALSAVAAATERLKLATGICLLIQRDPITTAKEVASLDRLSGGRMLFGVGAGWNREEMANHGTDPATRMRLLGERVEAMKALWTDDEATYHGERVALDRVWQWPKPVQSPHPPVLVGGNGPTVLDRVMAFGDEWMPNWVDDEWLADRIAELGRRASAQGRPTPPVTISGVPSQAEALQRYADMGASRCVMFLPSEEEQPTLERIQRRAAAAGLA
jgi:probable F420-dependent oxidoreductase